jgi:hypothetical protein
VDLYNQAFTQSKTAKRYSIKAEKEYSIQKWAI